MELLAVLYVRVANCQTDKCFLSKCSKLCHLRKEWLDVGLLLIKYIYPAII